MCLFLVPSADTPQPYKDRGTLENDVGQRKACRFSKVFLDVCSGDSDPTFGFKEGKPCIIVKLNRIVNFRPKVGLLHTSNNIVFCYYRCIHTDKSDCVSSKLIKCHKRTIKHSHKSSDLQC